MKIVYSPAIKAMRRRQRWAAIRDAAYFAAVSVACVAFCVAWTMV